MNEIELSVVPVSESGAKSDVGGAPRDGEAARRTFLKGLGTNQLT